MPELPGILGSRRNGTTPSPDVSEPLDLLIKGEASKKSQTQVSLDAMEEPPVVAPEEVIRSDVFERCTPTGSEPFSLSKSLEATKLALLRVLTLVETICPKICSKSRFKSSKSPLPVNVHRSRTSLLKLLKKFSSCPTTLFLVTLLHAVAAVRSVLNWYCKQTNKNNELDALKVMPFTAAHTHPSTPPVL